MERAILLTGLQHLGLEQGGQATGWGGLPRGGLPPHCLPPPPAHHSHAAPTGTVAVTATTASAFNPFHHTTERRSPRLPAPANGENYTFDIVRQLGLLHQLNLGEKK